MTELHIVSLFIADIQFPERYVINQQINQSSSSLFSPCIMQFSDNTQLYFFCNYQL